MFADRGVCSSASPLTHTVSVLLRSCLCESVAVSAAVAVLSKRSLYNQGS